MKTIIIETEDAERLLELISSDITAKYGELLVYEIPFEEIVKNYQRELNKISETAK